MSGNQPPYGGYPQPPQQQPWGYPPQPRRSHTLRNLLLVLTVLSILVVGGCLAVMAGVVYEVDQAAQEDTQPGGPDNPLAIEPGQSFEVYGFRYLPGWSVEPDALGLLAVKGLRVENNRSEKDSAIVEIKLWRGKEVVAVSDCSTEPIAAGTKSRLLCISADEMPTKYDRVTINDTF